MQRTFPNSSYSLGTMPEEVVFIAMLTIIFGSVVAMVLIRSVMSYLRDKNQLGEGGDGIRMAELEALVEQAVHQAQEPLLREIRELRADQELLQAPVEDSKRKELVERSRGTERQ